MTKPTRVVFSWQSPGTCYVLKRGYLAGAYFFARFRSEVPLVVLKPPLDESENRFFKLDTRAGRGHVSGVHISPPNARQLQGFNYRKYLTTGGPRFLGPDQAKHH